ncbi:hypothetical protein F9817_06865 [Vibrio sp. CAIM 722]|uniref:Baseplate protein J-like domain-containing protein n=1 Tax=Vibrio eleionomae TaxID=2653505 RepID=A0A7X4RTL0_9VIBR|nr:hypothetical protein [Vibrio eleionomae]MZI92916.1 hypothetical protein [Vibrio eleionomae]
MTSRQQQLNNAINPSVFQCHELSFEQLVVWAKQFAQQLPFRNLQDQAQGTWGNLFQHNEIVVCAAILTSDTKYIQTQFRQVQRQGEEMTAQFLLVLLKRLQEWYLYLPGAPESAYQFKYYLLDEYQTHLSLPISLVIPRLPEQFRARVQELDALWNLDEHMLDTGPQTLQDAEFTDQARHCFAKIIFVIEQIKQQSQTVLKSALSHQQNGPQLALYFAFLKLFERAQNSLNQFTEKHLNFYYQDVLQQEKQATADDAIFLKLSLNNKTHNTVSFAKHAEFSPGDDSDFKPIIYRSQYPIEVTDAEVTRVFNLTLQRDPLVSPERESGYACGVSAQQQQLDITASGENFPLAQQFPFFHNEHSSEDEFQPMGMIITDPIFTMAQGNRYIDITLHLKEQRANIIEQELINAGDDEAIINALTRVFHQLLATHDHLFEEWSAIINANNLVTHISAHQRTKLQQLEAAPRVSLARKLFYFQLLDFVASSLTNDNPLALTKVDLLFRIIGQIVSRQCLYTATWLTKEDSAHILTIIAPLLGDDLTAYTTIQDLLCESSTAAFYHIFQDVFDIAVTTDEGWETLSEIEIHPGSEEDCHIGFKLKCYIDTGFEAIVPNQATRPDSASLKITLKPQSNCFPYSIFRDFELAQLTINTQVNGVTQLQLFNQEGQADTKQPFFLLGSQPYIDSYAVIASEEIARKSLTQLSFHFTWGGLPLEKQGFEQYYAQYPYAYTNSCFKIAAQVLNSGQWTPIGPLQQSLFTPAHGALDNTRSFYFSDIDNSYTPVTRPWPEVPYNNQTSIRNGLFQLKLTGPDTAFGHNDYAPLFSDILTHNVKSKHKKARPNQPYAPLVNQLSINYSAQSVIDLQNNVHKTQSELIHLHPFGQSLIYPQTQSQQMDKPRLLANYQEDSHCFIGIKASELYGYLNLYFAFDGSAKLLMPYPSTAYNWYYLVDNQWQPLNPNKIIHDTTQSFLTSGVVTLDIPGSINKNHTVMPSGLFWLRVSTNKGIDQYPVCQHVATHVVQVNGKGAPMQDDGITPLSFSTWRSKPKVTNLAAIAQLNPMTQPPELESDQQFQMRVSERLRHKNKVLTPWDYEHLILEHFPKVGAVHCFPTRSFYSQEREPGKVLIIVTPSDIHCDHKPCLPKKLDASYLLSIRQFLLSVSRPHVQIEVRNPGYEKIQIRCKVTLKEGVSHGPALRKLEQAIKSQLCPWEPNSLNTGLGFGLSLEKLGAFIRSQDKVVNVSSLSALKISIDEDTDYSLQDSAATHQPIQAAFPWFLLIPEVHHYIQISTDNLAHDPEEAGIGDLVIGEQFIIHSTTTSNNKGTEE